MQSINYAENSSLLKYQLHKRNAENNRTLADARIWIQAIILLDAVNI